MAPKITPVYNISITGGKELSTPAYHIAISGLPGPATEPEEKDASGGLSDIGQAGNLSRRPTLK